MRQPPATHESTFEGALAVHALPQAPQWVTSPFVSTHSLPHGVRPGLHCAEPPAPLPAVALPLLLVVPPPPLPEAASVPDAAEGFPDPLAVKSLPPPQEAA